MINAVDYFLSHPEALRHRSTWYDMFSVDVQWVSCTFSSGGTYHTDLRQDLFPGRLCNITGTKSLYPIINVTPNGIELDTYIEVPMPGNDEQLVSPDTIITVSKDVIANGPEKPGKSTFGIFLLNYYLLADVFGDAIPYHNAVWGGDLDSLIVEYALSGAITTAQLHIYADRVPTLGHTSELTSPSLTRACLSVGSTIRNKKAAILDKYRQRIQAGDSGAMVAAEQEIAKAIKEALAGDPSLRFLLSGKNINVQLLKMVGVGGSSESLTQPGKFNFIEESLTDDRKISSFPAVANETRGASISRALETAKGGEDSKYLIRMFQNVRITMDDCGATKYLELPVTPEFRRAFSYRTALINGKLVVLTRNVMKSIPDGTMLKVRSAMYCKCKNGYCFTCVSMVMKRLEKASVTMSKLALGSFFLTLALKAMHGSSRDNIPVKLEDFTLDVAYIP